MAQPFKSHIILDREQCFYIYMLKFKPLNEHNIHIWYISCFCIITREILAYTIDNNRDVQFLPNLNQKFKMNFPMKL